MLRATAFLSVLVCSATVGAACSSETFQVASPVGGADGGADVGSTDGAPSLDGTTPDAFVLPPDAAAEGQYPEIVIADGPIGYWRLDDPIGAPSAADSSSGAQPGTCVAPVAFGVAGALETDPGSTSVDFQGGRITMGDNFDFVGTSSFSLEVWIRPAYADDKFRRILAKESAPPAVREGYSLELVRPSGLGANEGRLTFLRLSGGDAARVSVDLAGLDTMYRHVVVTYDGSVLALWVDAVRRSVMSTTKPVKDTGSDFFLAGDPTVSNYRGHLDEVAVYDHALAEKRILAHWAHRRR